MKRRVFGVLILITILAASVIPYASFADDAFPFKDVPETSWMYIPVNKVYSAGYMVGTSDETFSPGDYMNRAMMVVVLAKISGDDLTAYERAPFSDVPENSYYARAVNWAYANGITAGNENGEYAPNSPLTREQVIVFLRAFGDYLNYDVTYEDRTMLILYHDNHEISTYARGAVSWALDYGLISGNDDHALNPRKPATRAEFAAMLVRFLGYTETPPIVPPVIYEVNFYNWDGTLLYTDNVAAGGNATYRGDQPQRAGNEYYQFVFTGWDKDTSVVNGPTSFIAQFEKGDIVYTAKFVNWDGTLLCTEEVKAGDTASYNGSKPVRSTDDVYAYTFKKWDKDFEPMFSDMTYKAQYDPRPKHLREIHEDVFAPGTMILNGGNGFKMSTGLFNRLNNLLYSSGGRTVGFYVVDLGTNMTFGYNANMDFQTASTVKLGMALTAFKRAEQGYFSFDDYWTFLPRHFCERTGTIIDSPYGTKFKAREVLHRMINISDNAAYYMTHDYVGVKPYNDILSSIGVKHMHTSYASWGFLTPQELGFIWYEIYYYRTTSSYGEALFNELLNAQFNFIKQGLNGKYSTVAHKSGWNDNGYHDSSIVFAERPYIMVIMTKPGTLDGNQYYLARVARLLDEFMSEYTFYLNNR